MELADWLNGNTGMAIAEKDEQIAELQRENARLRKGTGLLRAIYESTGSSAMQVLGDLYDCKVVAISKDSLTQIGEFLDGNHG